MNVCTMYVRNKIKSSETISHISYDFKFEGIETTTNIVIKKKKNLSHTTLQCLIFWLPIYSAICYTPLKNIAKPFKWLHNSMQIQTHK